VGVGVKQQYAVDYNALEFERNNAQWAEMQHYD
jgi:hypothetical protein